ncbi:MAG: energy transducer TonB [Pseudomonadota bacterium]
MVLIQRHPHALPQAIADIQPVRILGLAGAIALNIAALMLLLVPVSAPMQIEKEDDPWYMPEDRRIEPPKPPEPVEVPIVRPQPRTQTPVPIVQPQPQPQPAVDNEVIVPDGSEYVPPTETTDTIAPPTLPASDPLPSTRLEYASAPAPSYPREAILDGIEGTVVLKVLVDVDGKPLSVEIERSSGNRHLDAAARRQVLRKWLFKPAVRDGRAVQVYGMVPVNFSLTRD